MQNIIHLELDEFQLAIYPNVYSPREDSFLFIDFLKKSRSISQHQFLEIGTGSGIISILLGKHNLNVTNYASDLNYMAALNAKDNLKSNGIENVMIVCTDFFKSFRKNSSPKLVIFNPPYLPDDPEMDPLLSNSEKIQFSGGIHGYETLSELLAVVDCERIISMISSNAISVADYQTMHPQWNIEILDQKSFAFEKIVLISMERGD